MATLLLHVFGVLTRLIGCWVPFLYSTAMMSKDNLDSGLSDKETGVWKNNPKGISNSFKQEASTKRVRHPQAWSFRRHGWQKSFTLTRSDLGISRKELSEQFVALQKEIWDFGRVPVDERDERDERRSYYFCEGLFIVYLLFFFDSSDQLVMDQSLQNGLFLGSSALPGCSFWGSQVSFRCCSRDLAQHGGASPLFMEHRVGKDVWA